MRATIYRNGRLVATDALCADSIAGHHFVYSADLQFVGGNDAFWRTLAVRKFEREVTNNAQT